MADRLFLGIPLPPAARDDLAAQLQRSFPSSLPGRVVPPGNWHITLRFLGATAPDAVERIRAELSGAALGPSFPLGLQGLGAFPRPARASVVWLGVREGADDLRRLARGVEDALSRAGIPPRAAHSPPTSRWRGCPTRPTSGRTSPRAEASLSGSGSKRRYSSAATWGMARPATPPC